MTEINSILFTSTAKFHPIYAPSCKCCGRVISDGESRLNLFISKPHKVLFAVHSNCADRAHSGGTLDGVLTWRAHFQGVAVAHMIATGTEERAIRETLPAEYAAYRNRIAR